MIISQTSPYITITVILIGALAIGGVMHFIGKYINPNDDSYFDDDFDSGFFD